MQEEATARVEAMLQEMKHGASSFDGRLKQFDDLLKAKEAEKATLLEEVSGLRATVAASKNRCAGGSGRSHCREGQPTTFALDGNRLSALPSFAMTRSAASPPQPPHHRLSPRPSLKTAPTKRL